MDGTDVGLGKEDGEFLNPKGIPAQSPWLRRKELPWVIGGQHFSTPTGLWLLTLSLPAAATPLGLKRRTAFTQRSAYRATLGSGPQSLWD